MEIFNNLHLYSNIIKQVSQGLCALPRGGGRAVYVERSKYCTVVFLLEDMRGGPPLENDLRVEQGDSIAVVDGGFGSVGVVVVDRECSKGKERGEKGIWIG